MASKQAPPTETMKISDAKQQLNRLANAVYRGETRVLIEKNGIPVAALISPRDLEFLKSEMARREADFAAIYRVGEAFANEDPDEIERQVALAVAETRAEWAADYAKILKFGAGFAGETPEAIQRETDLAVAEVRAEMRAERAAEAAARIPVAAGENSATS